ncbi:FtsX-like permease family protein [Actinomadura pelletieri DSM 43383]|uniref:FtsX-like permease family protein n=1 Tax=Actinomadura pelletieri DSM 43383 TaxID=1120940 RepID=A0A495QQ51_9ACTN|nr:FtsX-like permease family protein [Actinomadura pelletieri]RKS75095.1 FtsX-like permease family protein [Actinomadura pelletieri DSM 43383]
MNRYRFALRIARQDARRAKGRTALILCMIGFPIAVIVALTVLWATGQTAVQSEESVEVAPSADAVIALAVTLILLEVALLAGPAFVVDARRRRRVLALVAASGGTDRDLRAVVLASGVLLGGIAALAGTALGVLAAAASLPIFEAVEGDPLGSFRVPWLQVLVVTLLGAGSGVLASLLPASQAARMDVCAALSGRRDPPGRSRRGWPVVGGVLVLGGVAMSLVGVRSLREFGAALGAAAIIIGLVLVSPWIVGASGRIAPRLPLPLRLAVRDGARNRARTAPAVAAIMAAVAAITALAIGGASDHRQNQIEYRATVPLGSALIHAPYANPDAAERAVRRDLPGVPVLTLRSLPGYGSVCMSEKTTDCPSVSFAGEGGEAANIVLDNVVGGSREARMLLGRDDPAVASALDAGRIVLFGAAPSADGRTTAKVVVWDHDRERTLRQVTDLPAAATNAGAPVRAIVPPKLAERIGLPVRTEAFGVDRADHRVTRAEETRLKETMHAFEDRADIVYVERGFTESFNRSALLLAAVAAILALGGALIATSLAAADARPDLATLEGVGARPRTRRLVTMGQAVFVAVLGCWLGIVGGLVPGLAVTRPLTDQTEMPGVPEHGPIVDVPWLLLFAVGVAVPLVAGLVAGTFARGGPPLTRRALS